MSEAVRLTAEKREKLGTAESRRLRSRGQIPGNIYGHKEGAVAITVSGDQLSPIINEGHKVVDLELGNNTQTTIFREVQWDTFGREILHFDLLRVDPEERRWSEVPIEFRGIAPGVVAGGVLDQHLHSIAMRVKTLELPDVVRVRLTDLQIGDSVLVKDLELPSSAELDIDEDTVVVQILEEMATDEPAAEGDAAGAEPEVVGEESSSDDGDN
ncbi:50S ribosomal protein L25 [Thalassoroseus pseudoceratinae]|uniref:50S ribosomal protein L25 n=1 Tax=Thalassoroseus pseudoceratinae TaxID=2713176 RepID=UPI00141E872F|nr:50S ribosomal protein L25 [Thalassoroseus pseudoceratinae]